MTTSLDHIYMARAIQLAQSSIYSPHPNPRVGCVITLQNKIIGEGWHAYPGGPHAEVNALLQVKDAEGATAYVTLEPCSHYGKTPPCADALIKAGIKRVVVAMQDPNPEVSGRGIYRLEEAGIEVSVGVLEHEAEQLNPGFIKRMRTGRPFVRVKLAMSLDGRTAMQNGDSKWITGTDARRDVQCLRAGSDAMLTGIGTVLHDDPSLTVRAKENHLEAPQYVEQARQPLRVVLDRQLRMPVTAKMLQQPGETLIFTYCDDRVKRDALEQEGAEIVMLSEDAELLSQLFDELGRRQINEVMVEAGSTLNGAILQAGLVDELLIYVAPVLMGDGAKGLFHLPGLRQMADKIDLLISDIRPVGKIGGLPQPLLKQTM